jgi:hypothetical protein
MYQIHKAFTQAMIVYLIGGICVVAETMIKAVFSDTPPSFAIRACGKLWLLSHKTSIRRCTIGTKW